MQPCATPPQGRAWKMATELNQYLSEKDLTKTENHNLQKSGLYLNDYCTGLHCTAFAFYGVHPLWSIPDV